MRAFLGFRGHVISSTHTNLAKFIRLVNIVVYCFVIVRLTIVRGHLRRFWWPTMCGESRENIRENCVILAVAFVNRSRHAKVDDAVTTRVQV